LFGNYIENTAVAQNNNAYALGLVLNKAKAAGSWQFGYYYRDVEPDAVVGGLNDSDFIDGGTDGRGHVFGYKYQWTKNIQSAVTYFDNDKGHNKDDFKRLQLDLIFKF
ncbi:MAG: putative porin, partial [Planctomycetota bacterium]